jgi:hypothetical protein
MDRQRQLKRSAAGDVFLGLFGAYGLLAVIPTQTWHAGTTVVYCAAKLAMVALPRVAESAFDVRVGIRRECQRRHPALAGSSIPAS